MIHSPRAMFSLAEYHPGSSDRETATIANGRGRFRRAAFPRKMPIMNGRLTNWMHLIPAAGSAVLLWASQPPLALWPLAMIALVPWLYLIESDQRPLLSSSATTDSSSPPTGRPVARLYGALWLAATVYWLVSLQGLRHAHPLMFLAWLALGGYLGLYPALFVALSRRLRRRNIPLWLTVPTIWVGCEWIRNYLLTGISALMLGHTMADVPQMIQIADLFGTYGVSFVIAAANVAVFQVVRVLQGQTSYRNALIASASAACLLITTLVYGSFRLGQRSGEVVATIALIQRDEQTEYLQSRNRELEIFESYARESIEAVADADMPVDAVVWPESMFNGGLPWMIVDPEASAPAGFAGSETGFREIIEQNRRYFLARAGELQRALAAAGAVDQPPHVIAGCGVARYGPTTRSYSGVVHINPRGELSDWYGKTHLVMFGEYIPLLGSIPLLNALMPPGMGLALGEGPEVFDIGDAQVSPNLCIETAVERVTINQLAELNDSSSQTMPDAIVTVTNDAWFDGSSVVDHHLRCAQLVAVGCRRPILSAANGGPTAWIDSRGQVVKRLATTANGAILARPIQDDRISWYVRIGDLPTRLLGLLCIVVLADALIAGWRQRRAASRSALGTDET